MNLKNLDKKLIIRIAIIFGIIIITFIGVIIFKLITGGKIEYSKIEKQMVNAAKAYYENKEEKLPTQNGSTVMVTIDELIKNGNMKSLDKLVQDEGATCTGQVIVTKNDDYYLYSPYLDCKNYYTTQILSKMLTSNNIVTNGNGLYQIDDNYIYRGENLNNYLYFAGKIWYILRINSDGSIRILETTNRDKVVWDDRYNSEKEGNTGINKYSISRIKNSIDEIYNNPEEFSEEDKMYIVNKNLCIGGRSENDTINNGSIECAEIIENQPLGLLQVNEYLIASLDDKCYSTYDQECTNYNYLTEITNAFWTITKDSDSTHKVYKISNSPFLTKSSGYGKILLTTTINANVIYKSGDGSLENPYTFN